MINSAQTQAGQARWAWAGGQPARWLGVLLLLTLPWLLGAARGQAAPCDPAAACFDVFLSLPDVVGDFYLDGNLVATGVNSARLTGTPGEAHTVEVRNMQAPGKAGFGSLFVYTDQSAAAQTNAGWVWRVFFYPRQQYIRGTLRYVCQPLGFRAGESIACRPTIDGATMPDVPPGGSADYVLDPGPHAVHTDLVGDQASNWSVQARDDTANVIVARTSWLTASFPLKGRIRIGLAPAGLVADLYLDGNLVAAQAASAEVFTTPQVAHRVEARNVFDPAAGERYRFNDASLSVITYAGGLRYANLWPQKVWLQGTLSFFCQINRKAASDDAQCLLRLDGGDVATVPAGTRAAYNLATGAHTLEALVVGGSASRWDGPVSAPLTIFGGRTSYNTARFNLKPAAAPVQAPRPPAGGGASGGFELGGQVADFSRPDVMQWAGMTWVKRQVRWSPGAGADAGLIEDAHAKGFKILLSVLGNPADIAGGANYGDFARFVGDLARLGADGIEVWNEMNIDREWPTGEIDPARYTEMLRQSYLAIKANNPGTLVISGAPAPTGAEGAFGSARVWNDDRYVAGMAAAGAANYMDCIGAHYNEGIIGPYATAGDPRGGYYTRYYGGMVSTYYNTFRGARKVCFTELGYLSAEGYPPLSDFFGWAAGTSVAQQAQWLADAASIARSSGVVRLMIVFNVDFTVYGDDPQAGYAIIRPGGGCPACDSLRGVTGGR